MGPYSTAEVPPNLSSVNPEYEGHQFASYTGLAQRGRCRWDRSRPHWRIHATLSWIRIGRVEKVTLAGRNGRGNPETDFGMCRAKCGYGRERRRNRCRHRGSRRWEAARTTRPSAFSPCAVSVMITSNSSPGFMNKVFSLVDTSGPSGLGEPGGKGIPSFWMKAKLTYSIAPPQALLLPWPVLEPHGTLHQGLGTEGRCLPEEKPGPLFSFEQRIAPALVSGKVCGLCRNSFSR
jgi:hypothetical protein